MDRGTPNESDHLLSDLTCRQYLRPHMSVREVLLSAAETIGFCPRAAEHAIHWLEIDPSQSIGRLRRTELMQLARSIHRFWRHAAGMRVDHHV